MNLNETYKIINEIENRKSDIKIHTSNKQNFESSKIYLKNIGVSLKHIDDELRDLAKKIVHGHDVNIKKQLEKLSSDLTKKLDKINDNRISKIVILNLTVYVLNFLVYTILFLLIRRISSDKKAEIISTVICSFIVSPITDELAVKIEEKGNYRSSFLINLGSKSFTAIIQSFLFSGPSSSGLNQLIISLTGMVINKFRYLFSEEIESNIVTEKIIIAIRFVTYKFYSIVFDIINIFGSLIPGGGLTKK